MRLIAKTEEVVVKDSEIQEKDKLHKADGNPLGRRVELRAPGQPWNAHVELSWTCRCVSNTAGLGQDLGCCSRHTDWVGVVSRLSPEWRALQMGEKGSLQL